VLLPQEAAAKRVLPLLRAAVARVLVERGVSQRRAAALLGVSQPMVHRYASEPLEAHLARLVEEGVPRGVAEAIVEVAAVEVERGGPGALAVLVNWATLESRHCRGGPVDCTTVLCVGERDYTLLLDAILSIEGLEGLLPEVGSNLAYAPRHARGPEDVLALDGRIVRARARPVAAGTPVLGGSKHTGAVAAMYRESVGGEAWALALAGHILQALKRLVPVVRLGDPAPRAPAIAVVEPGGPGREQVVYLVAESPALLYSLASKLARLSSK